jgi:hypothetical protein
VVVTVLLFRLRQATLHVLDTGCILYYSHSLLAMTRATSGKALVVALRHALALNSDYRYASSPR